VRSLAAIAVALSIAATACGSGGERSPDPSAPSKIGFVPADGWNTVTATVAVGEEMSPVAWAATVPFRPEDEGASFPDATVAGLVNGETVISVLGPRPFTGEADFPQLGSEPLMIGSEQCISRDYEGQPQPHITLCYLDRWVGRDRMLNVLIWLGAPGPLQIPGEEQLEEANDQLARLVIDDSA
jgi:hypothetical protein